MPGNPLCQGQGLKAGQWEGSPALHSPSTAPLEAPGLESKFWSLVGPHASFPRPSSPSAPRGPASQASDTGGRTEFTKQFHILCATDPWIGGQSGWHLPDTTLEQGHPATQAPGQRREQPQSPDQVAAHQGLSREGVSRPMPSPADGEINGPEIVINLCIFCPVRAATSPTETGKRGERSEVRRLR